MTFTTIPVLTALDLTAEELADGDRVAFITKMNSMFTELVAWSATYTTAINAINALGTELAAAEASNTGDITALQNELALKVDSAVTGLTKTSEIATAIIDLQGQFTSLDIGGVSGLDSTLVSLNTQILAEINNRRSAGIDLMDSVNLVKSRLSDIENAADFNLSQVSQAVTDVNALLSQLGASPGIANVAGLDARLVEIESGASAELLTALNNQLNYLPDDGSFLDLSQLSSPLANASERNTLAFRANCLSDYIQGYNGMDTTAATEATRFYRDSSTNGGTEPALSFGAEAFITAMGLTTGEEGRYLTPFAIAETVVGSGTVGTPYNSDYYLAVLTGQLTRLVGFQGDASISFWVQPRIYPLYLKGYHPLALPRCYLDGVELTQDGGLDASNPGIYEIPVNQVSHIAFEIPRTVSRDYSVSGVQILAKSGGSIRWACMRAVPGMFQLLPTPGVVRSL